MFYVRPYKKGSRSAKGLAVGLGGRVLKLQGSRYRRRPGDLIINWGNTDPSDLPMLNVPPNIRNASNKKTFFQAVSEAAGDVIPRFWTYSADIPGDAFPVVCRTVLAGHSGEGIVLADSPDDLVPAPLYVEYIKKEHEFRVHLGRPPGGSYSDSVVIGVQRKARDRSNPSPNWKIRNHANGFIYTRQGFTVPEAVVTAASRAFCCLGLDFGAVDVIYNTKAGRAFVLEVNTAPGLEGQTVTDYVNFFLTYL